MRAVVVDVPAYVIAVRIQDREACVAELHRGGGGAHHSLDLVELDRRLAVREVGHVLDQGRPVLLVLRIEGIEVGYPDIDRGRVWHRRRAGRRCGSLAQFETLDRVAVKLHDRLKVVVAIIVGVEFHIGAGGIDDGQAVFPLGAVRGTGAFGPSCAESRSQHSQGDGRARPLHDISTARGHESALPLLNVRKILTDRCHFARTSACSTHGVCQ